MTQTDVANSAQSIKIQYRPKPGLGGLVLKNFLLNMITLYIYNFWAKTHVRKHIWSCVHIMDEPLEYTGRGMELALGFLIVVTCVFIPLAILQTVLQIYIAEEAVILGINLLIVIVFVFLIGVAIYKARRYRLSRTLWRGIRGGLAGSSFAYAAQRFGFWLLQALTFYWTFPVMQVNLFRTITNNMRFGNLPFRFQGRSGPLYGRFAILWFGTFISLILTIAAVTSIAAYSSFEELGTLTDATTDEQLAQTVAAYTVAVLPIIFIVVAIPYFLLRAFYMVAELNYLAQGTEYEGVKFRMNATTGSLIGLVLINALIMIFTLGIASPFAQQNLIRYLCDRLTAEGELDLASIQQSQAEMMKTGEGLAEVFDVDIF